MKAVDTFLRNIRNQEPCYSVWRPTVTESSTSALWKPQISPHIRDVLCANLCPESGYSDSGFSRFFSALPGKCRDIAIVRPRQISSTDLSYSLFADHPNNWRSIIWATNGDKEAISMYKYRNKYLRNLFSSVLFARVVTAFGVTQPLACLFQSCILLDFIRRFIIRSIQA